MSNSRTPPVHNLEAARSDLPLYRFLYAQTAMFVEPLLRKTLAELTSRNAAALFRGQLEDAVQFLREPNERGAPAEDETLKAQLFAALGSHLQATVTQEELGSADRALAVDMANEFAPLFWSGLLRYLREHSGKGDVAPTKLFPKPEDEAYRALMGNLSLTTHHYALSEGDLYRILRKTLEQLVKLGEKSGKTVVRFPFGLRLDLGSLRRHLAGEPNLFQPSMSMGLPEPQMDGMRMGWPESTRLNDI